MNKHIGDAHKWNIIGNIRNNVSKYPLLSPSTPFLYPFVTGFTRAVTFLFFCLFSLLILCFVFSLVLMMFSLFYCFFWVIFLFACFFFLLRSMGENCTKIKIVWIDVMYIWIKKFFSRADFVIVVLLVSFNTWKHLGLLSSWSSN